MTRLLYLKNFSILEFEATVVEIKDDTDAKILVLDQTYFYAQGGGQPGDTGVLQNDSGTFEVTDTRFVDGLVLHKGHFVSGEFSLDQTVTGKINAEKRALHSRLHSGGHAVDWAVNTLDLPLVPGKGFHFPQGPYVEYQGVLPEDLQEREKLREEIEREANAFVAKEVQTHIIFAPKEELSKYCRHVPTNLPEGKPTRVIQFGDFGVPFGGTHVANSADLGHVVIRKIKQEKGVIKVQYNVE